MKRIFVILLTLVLLLGICPMSALAETGGSGNVDGGGGDMGQGTSQNSWNPGMDGVRITVVDAESGQPVSSSFDLTNKTPSIKIHFGKVSKIQYVNGASISPTTGNYDYYTPATPMPRIVSSGSQKASIEAIKKYFCSEYAVKLVAQQTGIAYEELIGGQYKLFLEPIAYFKHNGIMMAMTAHEAALYDNQAGGSLRKTMTSLTHKNLPLAMFLEYADMGFPAYKGATNKTCSNDTIITYLGMGIVWFTDPPEQPEPTDYDYEYRVDTDVITPVTLYAGSEINPDSPATVSFSINGSTYRMNNIVIPSGDSQIAWVKWHTPSEPQDITIYVSTNKGSLSQSTIRAKVVDLSGNDPPDPKATDTMGSWSASSVPSRETKTYAAWSVWWAKWHPYWVWHSTGKNTGYWVDDGWYDYFRDNYSASMTATTRIEPDEKVPTASGDLMKSGYGMGIVWFTDPPEQPEPTDYDYEYRVDTDVITPVTLYAGSEINPDSPATVSFSINGSTYRMNNIVIPSGDSQIAWVKWHTPSEPQDITIYVSTNKGSLSQSTIRAKVVDLSGNDPPDPKATDTMGSWSASSVPSRETKTYAAWSVWWAKWHPYWVWHSTGKNTGYWVDDGWYDYFRDNYSASMTATTRIEPDEKVPTASGDLMKSGYGVTNTVTATVSTSAPLSHYTYGQTAVSYFPEFGYGTYWRLLERLTSGTTARFQFAKNIYSTYNQRVHFSPVWFPDGSYTVNTHVMDIWTPAGMLAMNLTDDVTISGSLYDDWHIAPGNP